MFQSLAKRKSRRASAQIGRKKGTVAKASYKYEALQYFRICKRKGDADRIGKMILSRFLAVPQIRAPENAGGRKSEKR